MPIICTQLEEIGGKFSNEKNVIKCRHRITSIGKKSGNVDDVLFACWLNYVLIFSQGLCKAHHNRAIHIWHEGHMSYVIQPSSKVVWNSFISVLYSIQELMSMFLVSTLMFSSMVLIIQWHNGNPGTIMSC